MSENTTTETTPVATKPVKAAKAKKAAKPAKAIKGKAKAAPKKESTAEGTYRDHDLPWSAKKVSLFRTLKACGAKGISNAVTAETIVAKSKGELAGKDVRHYGYHAKAGGLVDVTEVEGQRGYSFYLTAKGSHLDAAAALKAQEAAKSKK